MLYFGFILYKLYNKHENEIILILVSNHKIVGYKKIYKKINLILKS